MVSSLPVHPKPRMKSRPSDPNDKYGMKGMRKSLGLGTDDDISDSDSESYPGASSTSINSNTPLKDANVTPNLKRTKQPENSPRSSSSTPTRPSQQFSQSAKQLSLGSTPRTSKTKTPPRTPKKQTRKSSNHNTRKILKELAHEPEINHDSLEPVSYQDLDLSRLALREEEHKKNPALPKGSILALAPGMGKTVMSLRLLVKLLPPSDFKGNKTTLVICPADVQQHWYNEGKKLTKNLMILMYRGQDLNQGKFDYTTEYPSHYDLVICSYDKLRDQHALYNLDQQDKLRGEPATLQAEYPLFLGKWFRVIADESHKFRNHKSRTASAMLDLKTKYALCLSGTPAQNGLDDLIPQLKFIGIEDPAYSVHPTTKLEHFIKFASPHIIARSVSELDIPARSDFKEVVSLCEDERRLYNEVKKRSARSFYGMRERQATIHARLLGDNITNQDAVLSHEDPTDGFDRLDEVNEGVNRSRLSEECQASFDRIFDEETLFVSSKMAVSLDLCKEAVETGKKVVVFSNFRKANKIFGQLLREKLKLNYVEYNGEMSHNERESSIETMTRGQKTHIILVTMMAGSVGVNMAAASVVIILDPWWNPYAEEQAIGRCHRYDQEKPVEVYRLEAENTIDDSISRIQEIKWKEIDPFMRYCMDQTRSFSSSGDNESSSAHNTDNEENEVAELLGEGEH